MMMMILVATVAAAVISNRNVNTVCHSYQVITTRTISSSTVAYE
jgi:hypothetical protein